MLGGPELVVLEVLSIGKLPHVFAVRMTIQA